MNTKPKLQAPFKDYVGMNVEQVTLNPDQLKYMTGAWRVWELSLIRLNNYGHAPFKPGELAQLACGSDTPANRARVRQWMKALVAMGRIKRATKTEWGSTQQCIVVSNLWVNRGAGRGMAYMCCEPKHFDYRRTSWPIVAEVPPAEVPEVPLLADELPESPVVEDDYRPVRRAPEHVDTYDELCDRCGNTHDAWDECA
jgi:hypothetical protein